MKRLLLLVALMPAAAFAQQDDAPAPMDPVQQAVLAESAPNSGVFPADCMSPMVTVQLAQMVQVYAGNPMGDELTDFVVTQSVGAGPSAVGYSCMATATWRDHGVQHGMAGIFKGPGQSVIYQWHPWGY